MIDPIELHAMADGELTPEREAALQRLLADSPDVHAEFQAILTVKTILRDKVGPVECRSEWKACVSRLNAIDGTKKAEALFSGRFAWGLAGLLFMVIVSAGLLHRGSDPSNKVNSADFAMMFGTFHPSHEGTKTKSAQELATDELFKFANVALDKNRMVLRGQYYGDLQGRSVRRFDLRDPSGDLMLVVVSGVLELNGMGELRRDHAFRLGHVGNYNCVAWTEGEKTLALFADRPFEDLATIASQLESR